MVKKKKTLSKNTLLTLFLALLPGFLILCCSHAVYAMEDADVITILNEHRGLFTSNNIGYNILRILGWGITWILVALGDVASNLYDTCFGFVDFTKYASVNTFINQWKNVFIALLCLSLLLIGILLCIGWEKRPKFVINLLIAVVVVTSSTYVINKLNSFISSDVRTEIIGTEDTSNTIYTTVGKNMHDLLYIDEQIGIDKLKSDSKTTYDTFTKKQFVAVDINETIDPDDMGDEAEDILKNGLVSGYDDSGKMTYSLEELSDGVAWTDLLNEFYYRYSVDWGVLWLELGSLILVYFVLSYKVIRILYEVVIHRLLAYLYSANLNNNQKILKILDSLKDSYIILLFTTVMIKVYLIACDFVESWDISGLTKAIILLFIAFAVVDGPNLIQKLTGTDIGLSDGLGKWFALTRSARAVSNTASGAVKMTGHAVGSAGRTAGKVLDKIAGKGDVDKIPVDKGNLDKLMKEGKDAGKDGAGNLKGNETNKEAGKDTGQGLAGDKKGVPPDGRQPDINDNNQNGMPDVNGNLDNANVSDDENKQMDTGKDGLAGEQDGIKSSGASNETVGQGKAGYQMGSIGSGMESNKDALNGNGETSIGSGSAGSTADNLKAMEQDIGGTNKRMDSIGSSNQMNQPIHDAGHMIKNPSSKPKNTSKDVFKGSGKDVKK